MTTSELSREKMLAALFRRDRDFDLAFYGAVKTTGIYCRTICPAPQPKRKNVVFFSTANEARAQGFRACLRCKPPQKDIFKFLISLPTNFDSKWLLAFLEERAVPGLEEIVGSTYRRSIRHGDIPISFEINFQEERDKKWISVTAAGPSETRITRKIVNRMLDLEIDLTEFKTLAAADPVLKSLIRKRPGIRLPLYVDPFEGIVRAIVGQQVSVAGARTVLGRMVNEFGGFAPSLDHPLRLFPSPEKLATVSPGKIQKIGLTNAKVKSIQSISRAIVLGSLDLDALKTKSSPKIFETLLELPGIGPWTASYVLMRVFGDRDAFPAADLGIFKALKTNSPIESERRSQAWRPWRSYAVLHLWNSLPLGTRKEK